MKSRTIHPSSSASDSPTKPKKMGVAARTALRVFAGRSSGEARGAGGAPLAGAGPTVVAASPSPPPAAESGEHPSPSTSAAWEAGSPTHPGFDDAVEVGDWKRV